MKPGVEKKSIYIIFVVLAMIAIGVSAYLTYIHYMVTGGDDGFSSFCNINTEINCDAVAASSWSKLFGIPLSVWGILYYLFLGTISVLRIFNKPPLHTPLYVFWASVWGLLFTATLITISKVLLSTWCLLCAVLWLINIIIFILACFHRVFPFQKHLSLIWQDLRWWFQKRLRAALLIVFVIGFCSSVVYAHHKETKKQALLAQQTPQFVTLRHPISLDGMAFGKENPKLTIIELSDFECPHCKILHNLLHEMAGKYPIKVIHKDYPLDMSCNNAITRPFHLHACDAALFTKCADRQNKYWKTVDHVFNKQSNLKQDNIFEKLAKDLSLNWTELNQCMQSKESLIQLQDEIADGILNGFRGTPVIVFNGDRQLTSGWSKGRLERAIKQEMNNSAASNRVSN